MRTLIQAAMLYSLIVSTSAFASEEVVCESTNKQRKECEMDTRGEVVMVRQLSHSPCIDGQTWGLNKHTVWVENGCRAVFSNTSRDSDDHAYHQSGGSDHGGAPVNSGVPKGLPTTNATCPGGLEIHADEGGPVYFNGDQADFKRVNDNYYEASRNGVTVSLSKNPDGTMGVSYTGPGRANGICQVN